MDMGRAWGYTRGKVEALINQKTNMQIQIKTEKDLKMVLAGEYRKQIENFFGNPQKALEFLSNVVASVQRNPKLLECSPQSLINSFMVMASLKLMPSGVSGEAYVLPYNIKNQGMVAQFQLGYQGLVTLFYRAGVRSINAEIVHEKDEFSYKNGALNHNPDVFADDRGPAKGAYVIIELQAGGLITKVMSKKQILDIAKKFSKSFGGFGPWSEGQDPELWMWKKTVLKQAAKLVPKNETIFKAIDADNQDSIIADRMAGALKEGSKLTMGNLAIQDGKQNEKDGVDEEAPGEEDQTPAGDSSESN